MARTSYISSVFVVAMTLLLVEVAALAVTLDTTDLSGGFKLHTLTGDELPVHQELSVREDGTIVLAGFRATSSSDNQATVTVVSEASVTVADLVGADDVVDRRALGIHTVSVSPDGQKIGASDKVYDINNLENPFVIPQIVGAPPVTRVVYEVANDGSAALVVGTTSPGRYDALNDRTLVSDFPPDPMSGSSLAISADGRGWAGTFDGASNGVSIASYWAPDHSFLPVSDGSLGSDVRSLSPNGLEAVGFEVLPSGQQLGMWWSDGVRTPLLFDDGSPFEGIWFGATDTQVLGGATDEGRGVIYSPGLGSVRYVEDFVFDQTGVSLGVAPTEVFDVSEMGDSVYFGVRGSEHILEMPSSSLVVPSPSSGALALGILSFLGVSKEHRRLMQS